jgi:putative oxidoreductase
VFEIQPFRLEFPPYVMSIQQASSEGLSPLAPELGQRREAGRGSSAPKRLFSKLNESTPSAQELGLALVRFGFGLSLALAHGLGKLTNAEQFIGGLTKGGFPAPTLFGWAAILSEFAGGLLLAFGLLTRPAAAFVLATLAVAAFHIHGSDPFQRKELALAYVLVSIAVLVAGPGRFSLDARLFGARSRAAS